MIDREAMMKAYSKEGFYSLQLEVGDRCSQNCSYCYMNALPYEHNTLKDDLIKQVLIDSKKMGISAVEWLGGEPLLRKGIFRHMEFARDLGLRNNIWTGGLPLEDENTAGRCAELAEFGLISVHISTLDPQLYEKLHPGRTAKDIDTIMSGVQRILELGYPSDRMLNSVTYTGLQPPEDMISTIDLFEDRFKISTSLNVYHTYLRPGTDPSELERYVPAPEDVRKVMNRGDQYGGGPVPMNCVDMFYCCTTLAVLCDGSVTPCATIRPRNAPSVHEDRLSTISERYRNYLALTYMKDPTSRSSGCRKCSLGSTCFGCRSRAFSEGLGICGPDPRCTVRPA